MRRGLVLFQQNVIDWDLARDPDELHHVQWNSVTENSQVVPIHSDLVMLQLGQQHDLESFFFLYSAEPVALFYSPTAALEVIPDNNFIIGSDADVERDINSFIERRGSNKVDLASEKCMNHQWTILLSNISSFPTFHGCEFFP